MFTTSARPAASSAGQERAQRTRRRRGSSRASSSSSRSGSIVVKPARPGNARVVHEQVNLRDGVRAPQRRRARRRRGRRRRTARTRRRAPRRVPAAGPRGARAAPAASRPPARARAIASPIPLDAPVTTATRLRLPADPDVSRRGERAPAGCRSRRRRSSCLPCRRAARRPRSREEAGAAVPVDGDLLAVDEEAHRSDPLRRARGHDEAGGLADTRIRRGRDPRQRRARDRRDRARL